MSRRRVVITGLGTVNPLANNVPDYWNALLAGRSGIAPLTLFDVSPFRVQFGGEVKNFDPAAGGLDARDIRRMDRFAQFAMAAAAEAVRDSGLDFGREDPFRCGAIIGCGIGGLSTFEEGHEDYRTGGPRRINLLVIPKMIANAAPGNVSIHYGLMGPNTSVATACASAGNALGDALRAIRHDEADIMISGGTEAAITPMGLGGFCSLRALSQRNDDPPRASRPFDKDRDGFVLSEGAGLVVLEEYEHARKRGARIHAELLGSGATADAFHITAPHEEGKGAIRAMQNALKDARVPADSVDYVNAHGTSTDLGDVAETKAIKAVFGPHASKLAVSSTKSMIGHLLGASGGVELIACVLSIQNSVIHPTINLQTPDPLCDLDYVPSAARGQKVRVAISNSFGFGGHNACVVVGAL
jgi:3-oxoacyl-[acyl-carrier-protein] synthase II